MEVLSPSSFRSEEDLVGGERWRIAKLHSGKLPWKGGGEKSRPNYRLYYQIVLGSIAMEPSISALLNIYADTRDERPQTRGEAVIAAIMVDREGRPVESDPIAISSFGWGIPYALSGRLEELGNWTQAEKTLITAFSEKFIQKDDEDRPSPLSSDAIQHAYEWLLASLGLNRELTNPPAFAIRTYQYYRIQDPPEPLILNSFFLDDLASARLMTANDHLSGNLQRYLGVVRPGTTHNLMKDQPAIESALEPKRFPLGAWPAQGRYPLAMLQQCAVNLALGDLRQEGILAVNGPPGTGKTTLLRDVIAAIVTERAYALISFNDPESAFKHSGQKLKRGNTFIHLYSLDDKVRGFEVVVASSNNRAVENVSAELPGMEAIAEDASALRYFKTVSDNLLGRESWGAIAAVLGNAANRASFRQNFWWDEDFGLQTYLQHASGSPKLISETIGEETVQRAPVVTEREAPPRGHADAMKRWKVVQQRFQQSLKETTAALHELEGAFELLQTIRRRYAEIETCDEKLKQCDLLLRQAGQSILASEQVCLAKEQALEELRQQARQTLSRKPGLFRRLFHWAEFRRWKQAYGEACASQSEASNAFTRANDELELKRDRKAELEDLISKAQALRAGEVSALEQERKTYADLETRLGSIFVDEAFFEKDHRARQMAVPWLNERAARLRCDLFEAAMAVHKAFVDAAAKPIRHNLNVLLDGFGTRSLGTPERDALIPDLWATLFLVVPAVSTTFASVSRMFGRIGPETFGWLLIDEAGQALPQAAVGALMRSRRAVVVGDPIQIEPVVVLPEQLTEAICGQFGIDPLLYNAPAASAQTLADSATSYMGTFETKLGTREVGVPLLVHRRCSEPMFGISNAVAYENLMVQAKQKSPSKIRDALGPSRWINIRGQGREKWCPEEGDTVVELLQTLRRAGCEPNLYIVTPFVIVQNNLRGLLRSNGLLDGWVENPWRWVNEHVGTVHTVQGREAEVVIFVLGAPRPNQRGARNWAGARPNLLNVAATRAQEAFYVIGNAEHWKSAGFFRQLYERLPPQG